MDRTSGILMHVSSLPSPHGIGTLGQAARDFVGFLESAGQHWWQMLPLGPVAFGYSPYQSPSSCAGNPLFIDLDLLAAQGLLTESELASAEDGDPARVDYPRVSADRERLLPLACARFLEQGRGEEIADFRRENADWLEDYILFLALREEQGGALWLQWPAPLKDREPQALEQARRRLDGQLRYHAFVQMQFFKQWDALKAYAREKGVRILGDVPMYAALDSADVWAQPQLFQLDGERRPLAVAGVPPDYFSADGQLWGNPLYDWIAMAAEDYAWWLRRLSCAHRLFDAVRLDHFRALASYWAVPAGEKTAAAGHWEAGPGMDFIAAVRNALPELELIAEDLGYLGEEVTALLKEARLPGMKVLQFAFDSRDFTAYQPHTYRENCVVYTGTHDNDTLAGWLAAAPAATREYIREYFAVSEPDGLAAALIRGAVSSVASLCVMQLQDVLELPSDCRMNVPGTMGGGNWRWRLTPEQDLGAAAARLRQMCALYGRI